MTMTVGLRPVEERYARLPRRQIEVHQRLQTLDDHVRNTINALMKHQHPNHPKWLQRMRETIAP